MPTAPPTALTPCLTPAHERLWHEADAFAAEYITPRVVRMEGAPRKVERRIPQLMAARGWFGVSIPKQYGGMAAGHVAKTVLIHRTAVVSAAAAAMLQASLIPAGAVQHWGPSSRRCSGSRRRRAGRCSSRSR